jgi:hypothetical protein
MQKQRTQPGIIKVVDATVGYWPGKEDPPRKIYIPVVAFHALPAVVKKLDEIGWQYLLEGRPSVGWSKVLYEIGTFNGSVVEDHDFAG